MRCLPSWVGTLQTNRQLKKKKIFLFFFKPFLATKIVLPALIPFKKGLKWVEGHRKIYNKQETSISRYLLHVGIHRKSDSRRQAHDNIFKLMESTLPVVSLDIQWAGKWLTTSQQCKWYQGEILSKWWWHLSDKNGEDSEALLLLIVLEKKGRKHQEKDHEECPE